MIQEGALVAFWLDNSVSIIGKFVEFIKLFDIAYAVLSPCFELRSVVFPVQVGIKGLGNDVQAAKIVLPNSVVPAVPKIYIPMGKYPLAVIEENTPEYRTLWEMLNTTGQVIGLDA